MFLDQIILMKIKENVYKKVLTKIEMYKKDLNVKH